MSSVTNVLNTGSAQFNNYDLTKLLLGFNSFVTGTVTAAGADVAIVPGRILGRVASTGKIVACAASATDGSQYPVGVAVSDTTVADGTSKTITMVNKGKVAEGQLSFAGAETLATVIKITTTTAPAVDYYQKQYRDLLNDLGLELALSEELTAFDNS